MYKKKNLWDATALTLDIPASKTILNKIPVFINYLVVDILL